MTTATVSFTDGVADRIDGCVEFLEPIDRPSAVCLKGVAQVLGIGLRSPAVRDTGSSNGGRRRRPVDEKHGQHPVSSRADSDRPNGDSQHRRVHPEASQAATLRT